MPVKHAFAALIRCEFHVWLLVATTYAVEARLRGYVLNLIVCFGSVYTYAVGVMTSCEYDTTIAAEGAKLWT